MINYAVENAVLVRERAFTLRRDTRVLLDRIEAGGVPVMTHVAGEPAARALAGLEMRGWL